MLRASTGLLERLAIGDARCGGSAFALEFVRWRRKPRWLPVAKSKLFRVPERKQQDPDERAELMRLHNNYKTKMRAVRQYLRGEAKLMLETSTADHIVLTPEQEEADFQRCLQENSAWNEQIAQERSDRLAKERKARAAIISERLEAASLRKEEHMERIEAIVRREKELAKTFITLDNLDEAIVQALANPIDYNFAIDLKGNIYRGRDNASDGTPPVSPTGSDEDAEPEQSKATVAAAAN